MQQPEAGDFLLLLATLLEREIFPFLLFFSRFLVLGMVAHPELSANAVDLADTHVQVELLLQHYLNC